MYWQGGEIHLSFNNVKNGTIPSGFARYQFCMPQEEVDVINDWFLLQSTNYDPVCIFSLKVNGTQIFVGPENNQSTFWMVGDQLRCDDQKVATQHLTIKNKSVLSSICMGSKI